MAASPDLKLSYSDRESAVAKFDLQKSRAEEEEFDACQPTLLRAVQRTWPDNRRAGTQRENEIKPCT